MGESRVLTGDFIGDVRELPGLDGTKVLGTSQWGFSQVHQLPSGLAKSEAPTTSEDATRPTPVAVNRDSGCQPVSATLRPLEPDLYGETVPGPCAAPELETADSAAPLGSRHPQLAFAEYYQPRERVPLRPPLADMEVSRGQAEYQWGSLAALAVAPPFAPPTSGARVSSGHRAMAFGGGERGLSVGPPQGAAPDLGVTAAGAASPSGEELRSLPLSPGTGTSSRAGFPFGDKEIVSELARGMEGLAPPGGVSEPARQRGLGPDGTILGGQGTAGGWSAERELLEAQGREMLTARTRFTGRMPAGGISLGGGGDELGGTSGGARLSLSGERPPGVLPGMGLGSENLLPYVRLKLTEIVAGRRPASMGPGPMEPITDRYRPVQGERMAGASSTPAKHLSSPVQSQALDGSATGCISGVLDRARTLSPGSSASRPRAYLKPSAITEGGLRTIVVDGDMETGTYEGVWRGGVASPIASAESVGGALGPPTALPGAGMKLRREPDGASLDPTVKLPGDKLLLRTNVELTEIRNIASPQGGLLSGPVKGKTGPLGAAARQLGAAGARIETLESEIKAIQESPITVIIGETGVFLNQPVRHPIQEGELERLNREKEAAELARRAALSLIDDLRRGKSARERKLIEEAVERQANAARKQEKHEAGRRGKKLGVLANTDRNALARLALGRALDGRSLARGLRDAGTQLGMIANNLEGNSRKSVEARAEARGAAEELRHLSRKVRFAAEDMARASLSGNQKAIQDATDAYDSNVARAQAAASRAAAGIHKSQLNEDPHLGDADPLRYRAIEAQQKAAEAAAEAAEARADFLAGRATGAGNLKELQQKRDALVSDARRIAAEAGVAETKVTARELSGYLQGFGITKEAADKLGGFMVALAEITLATVNVKEAWDRLEAASGTKEKHDAVTNLIKATEALNGLRRKALDYLAGFLQGGKYPQDPEKAKDLEERADHPTNPLDCFLRNFSRDKKKWDEECEKLTKRKCLPGWKKVCLWFPEESSWLVNIGRGLEGVTLAELQEMAPDISNLREVQQHLEAALEAEERLAEARAEIKAAIHSGELNPRVLLALLANFAKNREALAEWDALRTADAQHGAVQKLERETLLKLLKWKDLSGDEREKLKQELQGLSPEQFRLITDEIAALAPEQIDKASQFIDDAWMMYAHEQQEQETQDRRRKKLVREYRKKSYAALLPTDWYPLDKSETEVVKERWAKILAPENGKRATHQIILARLKEATGDSSLTAEDASLFLQVTTLYSKTAAFGDLEGLTFTRSPERRPEEPPKSTDTLGAKYDWTQREAIRLSGGLAGPTGRHPADRAKALVRLLSGLARDETVSAEFQAQKANEIEGRIFTLLLTHLDLEKVTTEWTSLYHDAQERTLAALAKAAGEDQQARLEVALEWMRAVAKEGGEGLDSLLRATTNTELRRLYMHKEAWLPWMTGTGPQPGEGGQGVLADAVDRVKKDLHGLQEGTLDPQEFLLENEELFLSKEEAESRIRILEADQREADLVRARRLVEATSDETVFREKMEAWVEKEDWWRKAQIAEGVLRGRDIAGKMALAALAAPVLLAGVVAAPGAALIGGAFGAGLDLAGQGYRVATGRQKGLDVGSVVTSFGEGALLAGPLERAMKVVGGTIKAGLGRLASSGGRKAAGQVAEAVSRGSRNLARPRATSRAAAAGLREGEEGAAGRLFRSGARASSRTAPKGAALMPEGTAGGEFGAAARSRTAIPAGRVSKPAVVSPEGSGTASGRAGVTGAAPPGSGPVGTLGESGGSSLVHLTDEAGKTGILASKRLTGKHGIFAIPAEVAERAGTLERFARTGLDPRKTTKLVRIPEEATAEFQRPWAIGPYSAWKRLGGIRFARPGSILMPGSTEGAAGTLIPSSTLLGPRLSIYGTDAFIYATVGGAAYHLSRQESRSKAPIQPPQGPN